MAMERLAGLEKVENDILSCLQSAGQVLTEMSKDKPSQKQVDIHTNVFIKTLNTVELDLGKHINYLTQVSTGQAHEGSSYAAQKTLQMAWHRSEHMRSKVIELERGRNHMFVAAGLAARQRMAAAAAAAAAAAGQQGQGHPQQNPNVTGPTMPTSSQGINSHSAPH